MLFLFQFLFVSLSLSLLVVTGEIPHDMILTALLLRMHQESIYNLIPPKPAVQEIRRLTAGTYSHHP